jgi:hypothetical protein
MPDEQGNLTPDERTTALGLYNYAGSYHAAAQAVIESDDMDLATHRDAPANHLITHAIELYLKAFLRLKGASLHELKFDFGHAIPKLASAFEDRGGQLTDHDRAVFRYLTPENVFGARYLITGYYREAGTANLGKTAVNLRAVVFRAIRATGEFCRP